MESSGVSDGVKLNPCFRGKQKNVCHDNPSGFNGLHQSGAGILTHPLFFSLCCLPSVLGFTGTCWAQASTNFREKFAPPSLLSHWDTASSLRERIRNSQEVSWCVLQNKSINSRLFFFAREKVKCIINVLICSTCKTSDEFNEKT